MKLIYIAIIFTVTVLSQAPVITQTAQFVVGPVEAVDMKSWGDDFIVSRCSYDNSPTFQAFNQLILVNNFGEIVWTKDFVPRSLGSRNNLVITASNSFCIFTFGDTIYKINKAGEILRQKWLNSTVVEIALQSDGKVVVMELNTGATISRFFIYNEELDLIKIVTGYPGSIHGVIQLENSYFASGMKYGGGIATNISSHIVKYDSIGSMVRVIQLPDIFRVRLVVNQGRIYFCGVDMSSSFQKMIYGEMSLAGDTLWTKTWGAPYPTTYSTVVGCRQIIPSPDGGFVAFGPVTAPGQHIGEYEPNLQVGLIFGYSPSLSQLWIKTTSDFGDIFAGAWRDSSLAVFGNLGQFPTVAKVIIYSVSGLTAIDDDEANPQDFSLSQNYPNPFNPTTKIKFSLDEAGLVSLKVYDLLGREVAALVNEELPAGEYETSLDASSLASGVYIYTLSVGQHVVSRKMTLLR